jgi:hypothetical protein
MMVPGLIGKNRLLTIFSRPYTVSGGKKRGFCRLHSVGMD